MSWAAGWFCQLLDPSDVHVLLWLLAGFISQFMLCLCVVFVSVYTNQRREAFKLILRDETDILQSYKDTWNLVETPVVLGIASEQLRKAANMRDEERRQRKEEEESIIYGQAIHYTNLMVCLRTPLDASRLRRVNVEDLERRSVATAPSVVRSRASTVMTTSIGTLDDETNSESASVNSDVESGFIDSAGESGDRDLGETTVRWIGRFLDKVCDDAALPVEQLEKVVQRIPGFVAVHIENLEQVHRESKRLPPINKPKVLYPALMAGERMLEGHLRVFLLPDGRTESGRLADKWHSYSLLPAEGAVFLTNYRLVFKGQPCDPYICEQVVMRSMPILSMTKDKLTGRQELLISGVDGGGSSRHFRESLQIRSATFQLFKLAFDEEVSSEKAEEFLLALEQLRWPAGADELFAIRSSRTAAGLVHSSAHEDAEGFSGGSKVKYKTLRNITPKFVSKKVGGLLDRTAHHGKKSQRKGEKQFAGRTAHTMGTPVISSPIKRSGSEDSSESSFIVREINSEMTRTLRQTLEKLSERDDVLDFRRLRLLTQVELARHTLFDTAKTTSPVRMREHGFRLTTANKNYEICRSLPAVFLVPTRVTDDSIKKIAKGFRHARLPLVTWCSKEGALLIRGAAFHSKTIVDRIRRHGGKQQQQQQHESQTRLTATSLLRVATHTSSGLAHQQQLQKSSVEQERYLNVLTALSPAAPLDAESQLTSSIGDLSNYSLLLTETASVSGSETPEIYRRSNKLAKTAANFIGSRGSVGKSRGAKTMAMSGRFGSLKPSSGTAVQPAGGSLFAGGGYPYLLAQQRPPSTASIGSSGSEMFSPNLSSLGGTALTALTRASLYVFVEKGQQLKGLRLDPRIEVIPVQYPNAHDSKEALKRLLRVAAPSNFDSGQSGAAVHPAGLQAASAPSAKQQSHLRDLEAAGWLQQVKALLQLSAVIVDLVDIQNSSVAICLEDGWDFTVQVSSVSQVLLDPFYRTMEGFKVLVEKEWLSLGHRFSHRLNHTAEASSSGVAPIFLTFLDAVHQIYRQFPWAFEFNDFYLRFLAYHSTAGYYRTFLLDCEVDRLEMFASLLVGSPHKRIVHQQTKYSQESSPAREIHEAGLVWPEFSSVWAAISDRNQRSAQFRNFNYVDDIGCSVLRPQFQVPALEMWEFYLEDRLSHGSPYDLDCCEMEIQEREADRSNAQDLIGIGRSVRRVVDLSYLEPALSQPSGCQSLLENIEQLRKDLQLESRPWTETLDEAELKGAASLLTPSQDKHLLNDGEDSQRRWFAWLCRTAHKRNTVEMLLKGRMASRRISEASKAQQHGQQQQRHLLGGAGVYALHDFQRHNFAAPEYCNVCNSLLWGPVARQGMRCSRCSFALHERCLNLAPNNCAFAAVNEQPAPTTELAVGEVSLAVPTESQTAASSRMSTLEENEISQFHHRRNQRPETRTLEGYLWKKGARLRAWKPRWFVLDSNMHQMRYYESMADNQCRGIIDLAEVYGAGLCHPNGRNDASPNCYFDLKTSRRTYNLMTSTRQEAEEWIEKIQSCLQ